MNVMKTQRNIAATMAVLLGLALAAVSMPVHAEDDAGDKVEMAPLRIKLPKPMFIGTPKNIKTPNLERQTGRPRGRFMAPADAVIISTGKPVSGSDEEPIIGDMDLITDADKEGSEGSFVEFGPGLQWVQVDLEDTRELYAIVLWHYHSQARAYYDVVVRGANDPDFTTDVVELFNNDHDNSSGLGVGKDKDYIEVSEGKLIDAKRAKVRYLRFYSSGSTSTDMNHYIEVEVWGKPLEG
jgi:hypothetical protein